MVKIEAVLAALQKRAELLTGKRITAQKTFDDAVSLRQETLISGDLDDGARLLKMQNAVDSSASALAGLDSAISALQSQIGDADAQLDAERLSVERKTAADEIAADVAAVERLIGPWLASSREIADAFRKLDHVFEAGQLSGFISGCAGEAEVAAAVVLRELRDLPKLVVSGDRPIPHRPKPVADVAVIPPAPRQIVFCLRGVKWRDAEGVQQLGAKFSDVYLPPLTAARALRSGACVAIDDPRRQENKGWSTEFPRADLCLDLDADPATQAPGEPIQHSAFEAPRIGPAFTLKVAR